MLCLTHFHLVHELGHDHLVHRCAPTGHRCTREREREIWMRLLVREAKREAKKTFRKCHE
jgi:hypothetical protein